jgi:NitT/TauT family transport system substrate-binding protein
MDFSNGADTLLGRAGVESLQALRGKRIGVENTAVGAHMLVRALEKGGLNVADVTVVPLEVHEHRNAFLSGRIDALVTFEPLRSQLLASGAHELFTSAAIPGEITDVLVVHRDYLAANPEVVGTLLSAWFAVLEQGFSERELKGLSDYSGLSAEELEATLALIDFPDRRSNHTLLYGKASRFEQTLAVLNETMLKRKLIGSRVDVASLRCPSEQLPFYR